MNAVVSEHDQPGNVTEFKAPGPGERLRAARLARSIDVAEMAEQLHLTSYMVDALERDDYSELPARVFVRGYLRNYARLMELPVESIIRQFDDMWPEDEQSSVNVNASPRLPADGQPGRGWPGVFTWLILIAAGVLFLMWWRGYLGEVMPNETMLQSDIETAESDGAMTASDGAVMVDDDGSLSLPGIGRSLYTQGDPVESRIEAGVNAIPPQPGKKPVKPLLSQVSDTVDDLVGSSFAVADNGSDSLTLPPVAEQPGREAEAIGSSVPAPDTMAMTSKQTAMADAGVWIEFSAPCWVDIRGRDRSFKLFGEMKAGTRKQLTGSAPYKMVLGNARAVAITIDGEPYDISSHIDGNVARFQFTP